jgi:uncharacterized protein YggE
MKRLIVGLLLSVSVVGFAQKNFIDQNYIEVTGKAELEISPDRIYLKIVLKDKDNKDKLTLPEMEKKMTDKLTELGIDVNKDLSLMDFVSNLKAYLLKTNDVILTKQYQLLVRDAKTLQKVFMEFQKIGISNVSITKLEHSDIERYRKEVKVLAVKAAKEKAELFAIALNQKIGKAIYVQEADNLNQDKNSNEIYRWEFNSSITKSSAGYLDSEDSDIEFKKIKIESTFIVRFALE